MKPAEKGEKWKPVPTFEGYYEVSSMGRVYSVKRDRIMKPDGRNVNLQAEGHHGAFMIPVLIACAFLGLDITDPYRNRVLFKDGDSSNIVLSNLYIEDTSDLPGEEWRPIKYVNGKELKDDYLVSNMGRVKRAKRKLSWMNYGKLSTKYCPEIIISQVKGDAGYMYCPMSHVSGKDMTIQVHRLVATAFCENPDPEHKNVVNHIDGDPSNNNASNLEWCTNSENVLHAIRTGLVKERHKTLRYPVIRKETNVLYDSIADIDRAMGRPYGYCNERLKHNRPCRDREGNIWTLEVLKNVYRKIHSEGQHCKLSIFPDREFVSLSEASLAIGRWEGYLSEALDKGTVPKTKSGQIVEIELIGKWGGHNPNK